MLSFWETNSFIHYHHIVIGAGVTGLSLACELKERNPSCSVLVLERGLLPTGASTKNAGFACIGSLSENLHDIGLMGEEALVNLVKNRYEGLQTLRKRLGDANLSFDACGGYELVMKEQDHAFIDKLSYMNDLLRPLFEEDIFSMCSSRINDFGFSPSMSSCLILNKKEGAIDTGKTMQALWAYATSLGVRVVTGAEVLHIEEADLQVKIHTPGLAFTCNEVFVCTNAFTKTLFPELEIQPGRGQVIITKPIPDLKIRGTFFFDEGYFYFKNFENRIVFGGGRNLDFEGEETTAFGSNQKILETLHHYLKTLILPNTPYEIEQEWSGIMAFGKNKQPLVYKHSARVFIGVRLNGMGVALGSQIAKALAQMLYPL